MTTAAAARERLEVSREVLVAAVRAGAQLAAVGAVPAALFRTGGVAGVDPLTAIGYQIVVTRSSLIREHGT